MNTINAKVNLQSLTLPPSNHSMHWFIRQHMRKKSPTKKSNLRQHRPHLSMHTLRHRLYPDVPHQVLRPLIAVVYLQQQLAQLLCRLRLLASHEDRLLLSAVQHRLCLCSVQMVDYSLVLVRRLFLLLHAQYLVNLSYSSINYRHVVFWFLYRLL